MAMKTKEATPPAETPKSEVGSAAKPEAQKSSAQAVTAAVTIAAQVLKDGGAQKHQEKQELRQAAVDSILEQGRREGWRQESMTAVVAAGGNLLSAVTPEGKPNEHYGDLQYLAETLFQQVPELSDPANVRPRATVTGIIGEASIREQAIDGIITEQQADALVHEYWQKMNNVMTWDDYRRAMPEANGIVARSGSDFRISGTVSLGGGLGGQQRALGVSQDISRFTQKTIGQKGVEEALKGSMSSFSGAAGPKLGKSKEGEAEEGTLQAEAKKEDYEMQRMPNPFWVGVVAEVLAEDKTRTEKGGRRGGRG